MQGRKGLGKTLAIALLCVGCDLKFHDTTKTVFDARPVLLNNDWRSKKDPAWSPDGNFIAYEAEGRFTRFLKHAWVDNRVLELGEFDAFVRRGQIDYHVARNEIAYVEQNGGQLVVLNMSSGSKRQLTSGLPVVADPAWSNDGRRVAFTAIASSERYYSIWSADISGATAPEEIVSLSGYATRPSWSPDGEKIVFQLDAAHRQIGIADTRTGETKFLSSDSVISVAPDWSPDGSQIAFFSRRNNLTNERNIAEITWEQRPLPDGRQEMTRRQIYMLPRLPSIGLTLRF